MRWQASSGGQCWDAMSHGGSWPKHADAAGDQLYVRGLATGLPVRDSSVDAAIACLLLEHVADLDSALAELARVLRPGGRLLVVLNHPIVATPGSGWIDDHTIDPPEQYWQLGPYLPERRRMSRLPKESTSRSITGRCRAT